MGRENGREPQNLCKQCQDEHVTTCWFKSRLDTLRKQVPKLLTVEEWHDQKTALRKTAQLRACPNEYYDPRAPGEKNL